MLPPTRDQWYNDSNFNADEQGSAPPPSAKDDWWNTPAPAPQFASPPVRDDWWNDPNFNVQPPQGDGGNFNPPTGEQVPYIGDTYTPQAGGQAFTPKLFDLPPMPSTFGQAGESPEMAQRAQPPQPFQPQDLLGNIPIVKALRGDVAGAALDYGKNLSPAAPLIADSIAAGLKGAYDATPNIGSALMGKSYDQSKLPNEIVDTTNILNPFKNPIERGLMSALNEPFMQYVAPLYGGARSIQNKGFEQAQKIYQDSIAKGDAAPVAAAKAGYDFLNNNPAAPGMGLGGLAYRTGQELKQGKLTEPQKFVSYIADEIANGRDSFENLNPLEQIVAGFLLPDPIFSTLQAGHEFGNAQKIVADNIDRSLLQWNPTGQSLDSLILTGKKAVNVKTIEDVIKAGDLTPTNTLLDGAFGKRTPLTNSTLLNETAKTVLNTLSKGLDPQGKLDLYAALVMKAEGKADWIGHAKNVNLDPKGIEAMGAEFVSAAGGNKSRVWSPLESMYGEATGKVLKKVFESTTADKLSALLETAAKGMAEKATDIERTAGNEAAGKFAGLMMNAADNIVGVDRTIPRDANWIAKAWRGYQNFHSGLQLFTLGFPVRNILSGMTDTALKGAADNPFEAVKWMWEAYRKNLSTKELYYQKTGVQAETLSRMGGNMRDYENVSKNIIQSGLEKLGVPASLTTLPQRLQQSGELALHATTLYSQRLRVFNQLGGYKLVDATLLKGVENTSGAVRAKALADSLSVAKSPGEVRMVGDNFLGGKEYLNIQPDLAPSLERAGLKDPLLVKLNEPNKTLPQIEKDFKTIEQDYIRNLNKAKAIVDAPSLDIAYAMELHPNLNTLEQKALRDAMAENMNYARTQRGASDAMQMTADELLNRTGLTQENIVAFQQIKTYTAQWMYEAGSRYRQLQGLRDIGKISKEEYKLQASALWEEAFSHTFDQWKTLAMDFNSKVSKPADLNAAEVIYGHPTTSLPKMTDNYVKSLSEYAPTMYRETSVNKATELLGTSNMFPSEIYLSNKESLAIGQGNNKGILIEFDTSQLRGKVNTSKPSFGFSYNSGEAEFIAKNNKTYKDSIASITIKPDAIASRGESRVLQGQLNILVENNGWVKEKLPDGSIKYTKPSSGINLGKNTFTALDVQELIDAGKTRSEAMDILRERQFRKSPEAQAAAKAGNPPVPQGMLEPNAAIPPTVNMAGQMPLPNTPYDPNQAEKLNAVMDTLRDLRAQKDYTLKNWGVKYADATPEQAAAIQAVIKDYTARFNSLNLLADRVGTNIADQVLFNFGDKRGLDQYLSAGIAYPYWYFRNMARQTEKLWTNPHQLWALQNMHDQVKKWNEQNGITDPAKQYNINVGDTSIPVFGSFDTSQPLDVRNYRNPIRDKDPLGWVFNTVEGVTSPHAGLYDLMGALAYYAGKPELALTYAAGTSTPTNILGAGAMYLGASGNVAHPIEKAKSVLMPQYGSFFVKGDKGQDIYVGGTSDRKKMQMELVKMVNDGGSVNGIPVTTESVQQAQVLLHKMGDSAYSNDPNYAQAWAILKEAAARAQTNRIITTDGKGNPVPPYLGATLLSYFGGPGARYSTESEVEIEKSQSKLRDIMNQKDGLIAAGKKDDYAQLMRDYWTSPDNQLYALYRMGNSDNVEEAYAWGVISRMGVGVIDNPAAKAAGMNQTLLNQFYEAGGMPKGWTMLEKQSFMSSIGVLGSVLAIPTLATQTEWNQARSDYKAMQAAIATQFTPTQLANYEVYAYGKMTKEQGDAYASLHPEVLQIEQATQKYLLAPENSLLAAYYGSNVTFEKYAKQQFETEHNADGQVFRRYQALAELGKLDDVDKQLANEFYKKNEVAIKRYQADKTKFNKELDTKIESIRAMLPEPKIATIRPDAEKSVVTQPILSAIEKQKAELAGMGKASAATAHGAPSGGVVTPIDDASAWAKQYTDQFRAEQIKKNDTKAKTNGYLTSDNNNTYRETLQTHIADKWTDPREAQKAFYATDPRGWKVYEQMNEPAELMDYIGDKGSLREALMVDDTSKWTAVIAYVRQLTPDQLKQLKLNINDIDVVAAKAQGYTDAPSEYARSQIVGVDIVFKPDGQISLSEQSADKYFKNIGGFPKADGTTGGGSGSAARAPTAPRSTGGGSSRGGGSGGSGYTPQPRISAPVRIDETPALVNEWNAFADTFKNDAAMLVKLQDYFAQPESGALLFLQRPENANLALYISRLDPAKAARLRKAYLAWAKASGLLGASQQAYANSDGINLRVYPRRSGRSGLQ